MQGLLPSGYELNFHKLINGHWHNTRGRNIQDIFLFQQHHSFQKGRLTASSLLSHLHTHVALLSCGSNRDSKPSTQRFIGENRESIVSPVLLLQNLRAVSAKLWPDEEISPPLYVCSEMLPRGSRSSPAPAMKTSHKKRWSALLKALIHTAVKIPLKKKKRKMKAIVY